MPLSFISNEFQILSLIAIRVLIILSFTPIISSAQVPFLIRIVIAVVFAYIIRNNIGLGVLIPPNNLGTFLVFLAGEAMIGAIIGFYIQMVFLFLTTISEFFSTQMGLRASQVLNPLTGSETVVVSQFISIIVMMVFLSSYMLQKIFYYGITQSFMVLNSQTIFQHQNQSFLGVLFYGFAKLFEQAFIISLPMFISLMLVSIGLGLFGKVAPQMNLLVLGLPIQVGLGLLFLMFFLPSMITAMEGLFDDMIYTITKIIKRMMI